jgi:oxygen-independent coproporphyrinogen III oxidase
MNQIYIFFDLDIYYLGGYNWIHKILDSGTNLLVMEKSMPQLPNSALSQLPVEARALYHQFSRLNLPRHTSYPAVPYWSKVDSVSNFKQELAAVSSHPISFYVHVPFCEKLCHYCGCNKFVVSRAHDDARQYAEKYFRALKQELEWIRPVKDRWKVQQFHFGGGTPTWFTPADFVRLWDLVTDHIEVLPGAEISVELDPRVTSKAHLETLIDLGVNRVSLGIQDFDPQVQKAIERIQPLSMVEDFVATCRQVGFSSINFDLIYGLPKQTMTSMTETLHQVIKLSPDRIAFYRLALLPDIFKWQRTFKESDIPSDEAVLDFMLLALRMLSEYDFIGLDHFAKKTELLAQSMRQGTMRRSFQGMTTGDVLPIVAVGPSAITCLNGSFRQNEAQLSAWSKRLELGELPTHRYHHLSEQDMICRDVINELYCYRTIDLDAFKDRTGIAFKDYYRDRLSGLSEMESLGLVTVDEKSITVKPLVGWLLLRVVAALFDKYLGPETWKQGLLDGSASRVG